MFETISQMLTRKAREFMHRSGRYAAAGKFEHADDCADKASKKFIQAQALPAPWALGAGPDVFCHWLVTGEDNRK